METAQRPSLRDKWLRQCAVLRRDWLEVLRARAAGQDLMAGLTVAAVALPLNIALAVASGLPPSAGLLAGAIGGGIAAIFGGAPLQVTGPAAALNVMVLLLVKDFGLAGVAAGCLIIGIIQVILSSLSAGRFMRYVPEMVLAGFTTGVGLKLLDNQIPEFLGFDYTVVQLAKMMHRPEWLHEVSWIAVVCGLFVAFFVTATRHIKRFPAAIVAIAVVTAIGAKLNWDIRRVGLIPATLPIPSWPMLPDNQWLPLLIACLPLALLAGAESLLSAQAVDRMAKNGKEHHPNLELFGQGLANFASGLVGGMPVSGVIVRSSLNVQSGARTRLAALTHAVVLLLAILYLTEAMAIIPLAALAGLLCVVGLRLVEIGTFVELVREKKVDAIAFACAAVGTVTGHLMLGLVSGIVVHFAWRRLQGPLRETEHGVVAKKHAPSSIRAKISRQATRVRPDHYAPSTAGNHWLTQIRERAHLAASAFVHQKASVIGRVVLGDNVHVAAESSVRADEGSPFYIGADSNIQDGVVIHALKERWVNVGGEDWAVYIGKSVSVAHQALVHGPCFIGDHTFIGFQAVVHDSIVGPRCYIGIGAVVVGVEIPEGRFVPHGAVVDSMAKVDELPLATEAHGEFNEDVVGVNRGLAAAYRKHSSAPKARRYPTLSLAGNDRF